MVLSLVYVPPCSMGYDFIIKVRRIYFSKEPKLTILNHRTQVVGSYECLSTPCEYCLSEEQGLQTINGFLTYHLNTNKTYTFTHYSNHIMTTWYLNIYFQSTELMYSPHKLSDFALKFSEHAWDNHSWLFFSPSQLSTWLRRWKVLANNLIG